MGGAAYALLLVGLFFWPHDQTGPQLPAQPVVHEVTVPVVVEQPSVDKPPVKAPKPVEGEF